MQQLIAETTFLIDLQREAVRGQDGPACHFLAKNEDVRLVITPVIAGELASGLSMSDRGDWKTFIRRFHSLPFDDSVSWYYGEFHRYLRRTGQLIGSNDLWIAAAARALEIPILTRNIKHFERVPGIDLVSY